ncbi:hypothetical protein [Salmonella phage NINP13076]|uniref:Uncharacterized protein n=1 Tax=Salmonella phage SalP219 TaxID=3158864 RepID=A0AAU7PI86_9CAUD|nr:hypothetical protein [Salmonella phage NINP13076]
MSGISIKYESYCGGISKQPLAGFSIGNKPWVICEDNHEKPLLIFCTCGANNWTDNGRSINEYECGCCGEFILTEPKQEKINDK